MSSSLFICTYAEYDLSWHIMSCLFEVSGNLGPILGSILHGNSLAYVKLHSKMRCCQEVASIQMSLGAHWLVPWSKGTAISESDRSCKQSDSIFKRRDTVESSSSRVLVASAIFSACFHHKRCTSGHICASAQAASHVEPPTEAGKCNQYRMLL
jgi:hypothetical protein